MRIKRLQVGTAGLVYRYRSGQCVHECRACGLWETPARWRVAVRAARQHAIDHAAGLVVRVDPHARYDLSPKGVVELMRGEG
jgi:hypothetical protein